MANTCFNELQFMGKPELVKQANLFLAGHQTDEYGGAAIAGTEGYFQDLYFSQGKFHFGTRWAPDLETLMAVADRFKVGFIVDYSEPMLSVYGRGIYAGGKLFQIRMEAEIYEKIRFNEREKQQEYQGKGYRKTEDPELKAMEDKIKELLFPGKVVQMKIRRSK